MFTGIYGLIDFYAVRIGERIVISVEEKNDRLYVVFRRGFCGVKEFTQLLNRRKDIQVSHIIASINILKKLDTTYKSIMKNFDLWETENTIYSFLCEKGEGKIFKNLKCLKEYLKEGTELEKNVDGLKNKNLEEGVISVLKESSAERIQNIHIEAEEQEACNFNKVSLDEVIKSQEESSHIIEEEIVGMELENVDHVVDFIGRQSFTLEAYGEKLKGNYSITQESYQYFSYEDIKSDLRNKIINNFVKIEPIGFNKIEIKKCYGTFFHLAIEILSKWNFKQESECWIGEVNYIRDLFNLKGNILEERYKNLTTILEFIKIKGHIYPVTIDKSVLLEVEKGIIRGLPYIRKNKKFDSFQSKGNVLEMGV